MKVNNYLKETMMWAMFVVGVLIMAVCSWICEFK